MSFLIILDKVVVFLSSWKVHPIMLFGAINEQTVFVAVHYPYSHVA